MASAVVSCENATAPLRAPRPRGGPRAGRQAGRRCASCASSAGTGWDRLETRGDRLASNPGLPLLTPTFPPTCRLPALTCPLALALALALRLSLGPGSSASSGSLRCHWFSIIATTISAVRSSLGPPFPVLPPGPRARLAEREGGDPAAVSLTVLPIPSRTRPLPLPPTPVSLPCPAP